MQATAESLLYSHVPGSNGVWSMWCGQQGESHPREAVKMPDSQNAQPHRPATQLQSIAATHDQLLSASPCTEPQAPHSATPQTPSHCLCGNYTSQWGPNRDDTLDTGLPCTIADSNPLQQHASSSAWLGDLCVGSSAVGPSGTDEIDELLNWAASEEMQSSLSAANLEQPLGFFPQSSTPDLPCYNFEDLAMDLQTDSTDTASNLCEMYATLEQHSLQRDCHAQSQVNAFCNLDNLARQDMLSAPLHSQALGTVEPVAAAGLHTDHHHASLDSSLLTPMHASHGDVDALAATASASYELNPLCSATNAAGPNQVGCIASSRQLQHEGYCSGSGSGNGDSNDHSRTGNSNSAAARKRKGGRPRVYDLEQPIVSGVAAVTTAKPRGRGAKPKYVYDTPEEAIAKRRKRNRDTANSSYAKRKQRVAALRQQITSLQEERATLTTLHQLLQSLPLAEHGLVREQLQSGQSPECVARAVMQRMTANQNIVC